MSDTAKDKSNTDTAPRGASKEGENKKMSVKDKLRKKLEKLKKEDPNIYPVF